MDINPKSPILRHSFYQNILYCKDIRVKLQEKNHREMRK